MTKIRVRFAPSPTGALHIGGVRTALYNYLFAKQQGGTFILRIEDTDQTRYVPGAEDYIINTLKWVGLLPDEGVGFGGEYGPYRQSDRKAIYEKYAHELVQRGHAYYAFDTPEALEARRAAEENFTCNHLTRPTLINSLTMPDSEVQTRISDGEPFVVRLLVQPGRDIVINDLIRGTVTFQSSEVDDKVLLKTDGMPTYHLANIVDDLTPSGILALQVHAIGNDEKHAGEMIRFRNVRILTQQLAAARSADRVAATQFNYVPNTLSAREQQSGWKLLWDGRTTTGWRGARRTTFPANGWEVKDGVLSVMETEGKEAAAGGDIVTMDKYRNFELVVEYNLARGANSGIKYFVDTELNKGEGSSIGCEFQILDNDVHPDAKLGVNGNRTNAGLYDLIAPQNIRFNGIGEWNRARIIVQGRHVEHWLNGFKTVEYERGTQMWRALVDKSKYVVWPRFGEAEEGHILLQDHGNRVSFRSIKIRALPDSAR